MKMIIKNYNDSDDRCFALKKTVRGDACSALSSIQDKCNTYGCPFYKPMGCKDWIKAERNNLIYLIPPEEYGLRRDDDDV